MKTVNLSDIGNYRFTDLSEHYYGYTRKSIEIIEKKIKDISQEELLYLLQKGTFSEIALVLIIEKISKNGFQGYCWHNDDHSEWERDAIKELILLHDDFWINDLISFKIIAPIVSETARHHITLQSFIVDHFLSLKIGEITWAENDIMKLKEWIAADSASSVHAAYTEIKGLKRAIDNGVAVKFINDKGQAFELGNEQTLIDCVVSQLPYQDNFIKVIQAEAKIVR